MYNNRDTSTYVGMELPISGANIDNTGFMLAERAKFTARTAVAIISTANSNLNGSGTIVDLAAGYYPGSIVNKIIIKAQGSTTQGMIRLFHYIPPSSNRLFREIPVPAITQSAQDETVIAIINEPFFLVGSGTYKLKVSTEKAETFIVIAECMDFTNP